MNYKRLGKVPISPVTVLPYRPRNINFFNYLLMSFRKKEIPPNNRDLVLITNGLFLSGLETSMGSMKKDQLLLH